MGRTVCRLLTLLLACLSVGSACATPRQVRILHVNDFHGYAEPHKPLGSDELLGGAAALAGRVKVLRAERPSLLLAAGDMIQGNNWANLSQGASVVELMNALAFDAMVLGNHEFDFGQEVLGQRLSEAAFPVLGANVEGLSGVKPWVVKDVGGVRVAVVGLVTEEVPLTSHPRNSEGLRFLPAVETVRRALEELAGQADVVVALTHLGHAADRALAEAAPPLDVIVGGHSHTRVLRPAPVGSTAVAQAWEHGKALGVIDLTVEGGKVVGVEGRLEEIRPTLDGGDPAVQALVDRHRERVDAVLNEPVGEAAVDLDGEGVRSRETNLGNLVADVMRAASGAEATLTNGGGIRATIRKGTVRAKDVYTALPFDGYVVAVRLTGRQLRQSLEHALSGVERGEGRFPQVSGLQFTWSRSAPAGARVREVWVGGGALDPERSYVVATNDFLAAGGDGFGAFGDAVRASKGFEVVGGALKGEALVFSDPGHWLRDVFVAHLRRVGTVGPSVEGRIREVE